jgi:hypothetical protein
MVDPGAVQNLVRQLNRWYRQKAKPRGTMDHYHRGVRMTYTAVCRGVDCIFAFILLSGAVALYFVPSKTEDKPWLLVITYLGIVVLAFLTLFQTFRESVVVTDDCLIKSDLLGRETRMNWRDIANYKIKPDSNKVIFSDNAKAKLRMSLSYDGWQDFRETAARHLNPVLYWQFVYAVANLDAKRKTSLPDIKLRWPKWFSAKSREGKQAW